MRFTTQQYAQALYDSLHETRPENHDQVISNFIAVLKQGGDGDHYEAIVEQYAKLDREARGIKQVEVTVAREGEMNNELMQQLNHLVGKDAEIHQRVDAGIIGGVIIKIEDTLIDGSVKGQLEKLRHNLAKQ